MHPYAAYGLFAPFAAVLFWRLPVRHAILATYFAGWLLLPVGDYRGVATPGVFPWWIVGAALPSDMLVTKAWAAPLFASVGAMLANPSAVARWRPGPADVPIAGFCLWPLLGGGDASPAPFISTAYLVGSWGLPWWLGRIWLSGAPARTELLAAQAWAGLALIPAAVAEGVVGPFLYDRLYQPHPFRLDGFQRPLGFRPLVLFEHGNQYGIAIALSALAAIWLAWRGGRSGDARWKVIAFAVAAAALAAQSRGALLLLAVGVAALAFWGDRRLKLATAAIAALAGLVGLVHLSGIVPVEHLVRDTPLGQKLLGFMRASGSGSFAWRVSQDVKVLAAVHAAPLQGLEQWDWFRPFGARPWGLAMLLLGQFGFIGLSLALGALLGPAVLALGKAGRDDRADPSLALAVIVILAAIDALLNSFVYLPAILIAGALVPAHDIGQTARTDRD